MVGKILLPELVATGYDVIAYSRKNQPDSGQVEYRQLAGAAPQQPADAIADWICLAPIWTLPQHFAMLAAHRAKRIIALSSTSIFTKQQSSDVAEQHTV